MKQVQVTPNLTFSYVGPDLSAGPMPALFYFALSAEESLCVDPFNQPVVHLSTLPLRIFSVDLPGHGKGFISTEAMKIWAEHPAGVESFADEAAAAMHILMHDRLLIEHKIGLAGLSRGAFMACLVASKASYVRHILGFAPLTDLSYIKEFHHLPGQLKLHDLKDKLYDRRLRFYIGNRDLRVGTDRCFACVQSFAESAHEHKIRTAPLELIIGPSIGHLGHGTSKEVFTQGAEWMARELGLNV